MELPDKGALEKILKKRASGYTAREVTDEFAADENGAMRLVKRKVSTKRIPPDLAALKEILLMRAGETDFSGLSDEELEREKLRLLRALLAREACAPCGGTDEKEEIKEDMNEEG